MVSSQESCEVISIGRVYNRIDIALAFFEDIDPDVIALVLLSLSFCVTAASIHSLLLIFLQIDQHLINMKDSGEMADILESFELATICDEVEETGEVLTLTALGGVFIIPGVTIITVLFAFLLAKVS